MPTAKVLLTLALTATWLALVPATAAAQYGVPATAGAPQACGISPPAVDWGVIEFKTPTKVFDRILWGEYFIVHDSVSAAAGKPCTRLHERDDTTPGGVGDIAVAFYCDFRQGVEPTGKLTVFSRTTDTMGLTQEMTKYQFAGMTEEHRVPAGAEAGRRH